MGSAAAAEGRLDVYVVNYPLKYFAERIGGDQVEVSFPTPPGIDPVYWIPSIAEIGAYQQADLVLLNGAGYAKWVSKVSLPRSKTVNTTRKLKGRLLTVKEITTHSHGPEGEHAHEGLAFTTWLDFELAALQARAVTRALSRKRPEQKAVFESGYASMEKDLKRLDERLKTLVSRNPSVPLIFSHPVYDYMIRRYGLNARSVHWEPDQAPTKGQVAELKKVLAEHPARLMIWEAQPLPAVERILADMGVRSVVFNPCGNVPESGDFMTVMQANVMNLTRLFK
jgi:zinc transport system substrate-binding protein